MLRRQLAVISFPRMSKQYGRRVLFIDASFQLNRGEKVGPVGPNGSGKLRVGARLGEDPGGAAALTPGRVRVRVPCISRSRSGPFSRWSTASLPRRQRIVPTGGPGRHSNDGRRSSSLDSSTMAQITLPGDFKEFLRLLGARGVEYLLVGGYAVGHHGRSPTTSTA